MKGEYLKLDTVKTISELLNENKELHERIDKAIDYMESNSKINVEDYEKIITLYKNLLEILKGVNKNE